MTFDASEGTLSYLHALSKRATQGQWVQVGTFVENAGDHLPDIVCNPALDDRGPGDSSHQRGVDAMYIAAVQPKQVRALIAEIRKLRRQLRASV